MDVETALRHLGGVAGTRELEAVCRRRALKAAVDAGTVVQLARGRYALPEARGQRRIAAEVSGVLSHLSAAQRWGWAVKDVPDRAWVTVRRNRVLSPDVRVRVHAIVLDHGVLDVRPQVAVSARGQTFHPDLVDLARRVVVEADSWTVHSDHLTQGRDCVRYTALAVAGWIVLRFTWEQVMRSPSYVRAVLDDLGVALATTEG